MKHITMPKSKRIYRSILGLTLITSVSLILSNCDRPKKEAEAAPATIQEEKKVVPVEVLPLVAQEFTETGIYYGKVQGISEATLVSYGGGVVTNLKAYPGQFVAKGKGLCNIDGEKYTTMAASALLARKIAKDEFARAKSHLEQGTYAQRQVDMTNQAWLQAKQAYLDAVKMKQGALCISPIFGTVTHVYIEKNQNLQPGTPTIAIANLGNVKIKVAVPENEINGYSKKNRAIVSIPGTDDRVTGKIHSISQQVTGANRSFEVETRFSNSNKALKPGQTVKVELFKAKLQNVIVIPSETILNLEKGLAVMVENNGKAKRVIVNRGAANATHTVITSGLQPGQNLITKGHALVSDGADVNVMAH